MQHNKNNETPKKSLSLRSRWIGCYSFTQFSLFSFSRSLPHQLDSRAFWIYFSQLTTLDIYTRQQRDDRSRAENEKCESKNQKRRAAISHRRKVLSHNFLIQRFHTLAQSAREVVSEWNRKKCIYRRKEEIFRILLTCARKSLSFLCVVLA